MEHYSAIKENEMMPFSATWMDLKTLTLVKSERDHITYMWNLKYDTNEPTYETDSQTQRAYLWSNGRRLGNGWNGKLGLADVNFYIQSGWINNKVLLYTTENYIQYPLINHKGKEYLKRNVYLFKKEKTQTQNGILPAIKKNEIIPFSGSMDGPRDFSY